MEWEVRLLAGRLLLFNVDDISLVDINSLIDKGVRFNLSNDINQQYDDVREYLNEENCRITISTSECD